MDLIPIGCSEFPSSVCVSEVINFANSIIQLILRCYLH